MQFTRLRYFTPKRAIILFLAIIIASVCFHQEYNKENSIMPTENIESITYKEVDQLVQNMQPGGAVIVAVNNEIAYKKSFGYADLINKTPMSMDSQLLVGSVTKQFTAVAILKALYDKNIINGVNDITNLKHHIQADLEKTIDHYLPENHTIWNGSMPAWTKIVTVHQLLVHSSGIPSYTSLPEFEKKTFVNVADLVSFFKNHELEFLPGSKFSYSNSGYFLLGLIVQQITNQDLDVYMQKAFFEPLEMGSTYLPTHGTVNDLIQSDARFANLSRGYQYNVVEKNARLEEINNYVPMLIPGAGGSLISTAPDLLKWNNALYSGKLIPSFLVELMVYPHILTEQAKDYYAYGIEIIKSDSLGDYYTHKGGIPGFRSKLTFIPALGVSIIILENIVEDMNGISSEIERVKSELAPSLSENEKQKEAVKILENKYPNIVENKNRFELLLVEEAVINALIKHHTFN